MFSAKCFHFLFRRRFGVGSGHAEHQLARKSIWKRINCKRLVLRRQTRRLIPVSFATACLWAGLEGQPESCEVIHIGSV
jgi:uncharacterized protein (UPF0548 family)